MKKQTFIFMRIFATLTIALLFVCVLTTTVHAQEQLKYETLAPLPGVGYQQSPVPGGPTYVSNLSDYVIGMFRLLIGVAAGLAVIMIVIGGIEYMTSDVINNKESGKDKIRQALLGLLLAIASWLILNTIDPSILKADLSVQSSGGSDFVGPPAP